MIAALYAQKGGVYYGLDNVDPWDEDRDARLYAGPWPVVAHPPCARWSKLAPLVEARYGILRGDDGGCFGAALDSVRRWGGVLEHPEASAAWSAFDLITPPRSGGWVVAGDGIGWTCRVEQGWYGHRARKATWLYAAHCDIPSLRWGRSAASLRMNRWYAPNGATEKCALVSKQERAATPIPFRDLLISIAESANRM